MPCSAGPRMVVVRREVVRWCGLYVSTLQVYMEEVSLSTLVNAKIGLICIYLAIMRVHYLKDVCFYPGV